MYYYWEANSWEIMRFIRRTKFFINNLFISLVKIQLCILTGSPTLKRRSNSNPTVEPQWAWPETEHQAPILFPNKSVEPYGPKGPENVKVTTPYRITVILFRTATLQSNSCYWSLNNLKKILWKFSIAYIVWKQQISKYFRNGNCIV